MCVLSAPLISRAQEMGPISLILAVERDYPPFLFVKDGVTMGLSYDFSELLAQKLGQTLQLSDPMQLEDMLLAVREGRATLLADIAKTDERDAYLEFSDSYVEAPAVVITRKGNEAVWAGTSHPGVTVAVGRGYGVVSYLQLTYPEATFVEFDADADVVRAVALGAVDVGVLDAASLSYALLQTPLSNVVVVAETGYSYNLSFAVAEKDAVNIPAINSAIASITPEERSGIFAKWAPVTVSVPSPSIPRNVAIVFGIVVLGAIFGYGWIILLRKSVQKKTKALQQANREIDKVLAEKIQEVSALRRRSEARSEDIERAKRALLNVLEDIQADKHALIEITEKFQLATRAARIGILSLDLEQQRIALDEVTASLYGFGAEEFSMTFAQWSQSVFEEDRPAVLLAMDTALKSDQIFDETFRVILPNGDIRYLRGYAQVKRDESGKALSMIGVNFDVSAEKAADRLKTEFISLASHQLRTPLTGMKWATELLLKDQGNFTEKQTQYVRQIYKSEERMVGLVNGLLNTSRLDAGVLMIEPVPTDICAFITGMAGDIALVAEKGNIHFVLQLPAKPIIAPIDKDIFGIILENLVSNALKYTLAQGTVTVKASSDAESIRIQVADTGVGIPRAQQGRIFEKFFRADNAKAMPVEGTGLGLYMTHSMVEQAGGTILLDSQEGRGSTFTVTFPLSGMVKRMGIKKLEKVKLYS